MRHLALNGWQRIWIVAAVLMATFAVLIAASLWPTVSSVDQSVAQGIPRSAVWAALPAAEHRFFLPEGAGAAGNTLAVKPNGEIDGKVIGNTNTTTPAPLSGVILQPNGDMTIDGKVIGNANTASGFGGWGPTNFPPGTVVVQPNGDMVSDGKVFGNVKDDPSGITETSAQSPSDPPDGWPTPAKLDPPLGRPNLSKGEQKQAEIAWNTAKRAAIEHVATAALPSDRVKLVASIAARWLASVLGLYLLGWTVAWVRRGFRTQER